MKYASFRWLVNLSYMKGLHIPGLCISSPVACLFTFFFFLAYFFLLDFLSFFLLVSRSSLTILVFNPRQVLKLRISPPSLRIFHLSRHLKDQPGSGSLRIDIYHLRSFLILPQHVFKIFGFLRSFLVTSMGKTEASGGLRIRRVIVSVAVELRRPQHHL